MRPIYLLLAILASAAIMAPEAFANRIHTFPQPDMTLTMDGTDFSELQAGLLHDLMDGRHAFRGHGTSPTGEGNPHGMPDAPDQCGNCQGNSGNGIGNQGGGDTPPAVPEPGTFILVVLGLVGLAVAGGRSK